MYSPHSMAVITKDVICISKVLTTYREELVCWNFISFKIKIFILFNHPHKSSIHKILSNTYLFVDYETALQLLRPD